MLVVGPIGCVLVAATRVANRSRHRSSRTRVADRLAMRPRSNDDAANNAAGDEPRREVHNHTHVQNQRAAIRSQSARDKRLGVLIGLTVGQCFGRREALSYTLRENGGSFKGKATQTMAFQASLVTHGWSVSEYRVRNGLPGRVGSTSSIALVENQRRFTTYVWFSSTNKVGAPVASLPNMLRETSGYLSDNHLCPPHIGAPENLMLLLYVSTLFTTPHADTGFDAAAPVLLEKTSRTAHRIV